MRRLQEIWLATQVIRYLLMLALVGGLVGVFAVGRAITELHQPTQQEIQPNE